ncbi:MAG: glyoxalase [Deltaproteobacteria bacterium]|nr:glyoxalase [Deltaproteobacteria bacterium]
MSETAQRGGPAANRFSFTKVLVKDLDKLAAFYTNVFGFRQLERITANAGPGIGQIEEILLSISGDIAVEPPLVLFKTLEQAPPQDTDTILGLIVSDFDDVLKRLSAAGGTVVSDSPEHPATVARCAFARDPEGRLLEIVQMP